MTTILAIIGNAGVGKDTAASYLSQIRNWNVIHSYTNRPMRDGETNGVEHIFVEHPAPEKTFAYTHYGNYDYWTEYEQFKDGEINIYVIDEKGLEGAIENIKDLPGWKIKTVYISASDNIRSTRGVTEQRMERDKDRIKSKSEYDYNIDNNGDLLSFYSQLNSIQA